ncbi:MAG: GatB/YqeY domain-containing protein [Bryobacteraceae bacterium]|nr:GatB/YqeY domain-containing protein [Bryobacteraceae bacterium]
MSLASRIQADLVAAMKAKDEVKLSSIRAVKTALLKYKADQMKDADEAAEQQIVNSLVKQRKDSIDQFGKAGRQDLVDKETAELAVLESYLPQPATEEEIESAIASAIAENPGATAKQMGVVMKAAQAKLVGKRVDGKALSEKVRGKLG